jgi:HD-like signal output (HDOD) protein
MILKQFSDMLRQLFRSNARLREDDAAERSARLEQKVLALVDNMPTLPDTAIRAMKLAEDPNSTFIDLARLIEGDAAIATRLLRIANSALYTSGCPAVKLHQAVMRLGMYRCKNLIMAISMTSLFQQIPSAAKEACEALWNHGNVAASLCRQINGAYRLGFDGEEFSAGLLHDLGRILLALADPECFAQADSLDFREEGDLLARERAAIAIDHCALGAWFGAHSQLPETLIQAMRLHHEPGLGEDSQRLVALVATADHMANHLQRGEEIEAYDPATNPGLACLWTRWPEGRKERFLEENPALMQGSVQAANGALSS